MSEGSFGRAPKSADLQDRRDRELLQEIALGREDALAQLFKRYGASANGLASRILGDRVLAEDVVQEAFISVWRSAGSFDRTRGSVRSWLFAQVHHRAVDSVRHEESQRRRMTLHHAADNDDAIDDIIEEDWMAGRRRQVRSALAEMEQNHREILELAYFGGMSQSDIARRLGIPLGTVKSRTVAAMSRLRSILGVGGSR